MSRFITGFALVLFACVMADNAYPQSIGGFKNESSLATGIRTNPAEQQISVVRLRVPEKARALYNKAWDYFVRRKLPEAEKKLGETLKIHPAFPEALTLRGAVRSDMQQWQGAEEDLEASIHCDPNFAPAYLGLAGVYSEQRRFEDALAIIAKVETLIPGVSSLQYETARALIGTSQYERAVMVVDEALARDPDNVEAPLLHLAKAHALAGLGRYSPAATELETYLSSPEPPEEAAQARDLLNRIEKIIAQ